MVILPLTSCNCDYDENNIGRPGNKYKDLIIGKWEYIKTEMPKGKPSGSWHYDLEFFSNNTCMDGVYKRYSISGNHLTITKGGAYDEGIDYTIVSFTKTTLIIEHFDF